jgi:putative intracellular protease/amidase
MRIVAAVPGIVPSSSKVGMPAVAFGRTRSIDTLLIAGGDGTRTAMHCAKTRRFVRSCGLRVRRVASICSGTYLLAEARLLDGRRATTHWSRAADLAAKFPEVMVEPDRIFVKDGSIWSSAGVTAGIDLALWESPRLRSHPPSRAAVGRAARVSRRYEPQAFRASISRRDRYYAGESCGTSSCRSRQGGARKRCQLGADGRSEVRVRGSGTPAPLTCSTLWSPAFRMEAKHGGVI